MKNDVFILVCAVALTCLGSPALASPAGDRSTITPLHAGVPQLRSDTWTVRGDRTLRPASISDDGVRTYLYWQPEQSLPAVFAVGPAGDEEVVDGYMRGGTFVIDRVHSRLVFRIDEKKAVAIRKVARR